MVLDHFFQWLHREHRDTISEPAMLKDVFMDDPEFAASILETVVLTVQEYKQVIDDPATPSHSRRFYIAVHSLKSTAASIGMQSLAAILQRLESQLSTGEMLTDEQRKDLQEYTARMLNIATEMNKQLNT